MGFFGMGHVIIWKSPSLPSGFGSPDLSPGVKSLIFWSRRPPGEFGEGEKEKGGPPAVGSFGGLFHFVAPGGGKTPAWHLTGLETNCSRRGRNLSRDETPTFLCVLTLLSLFWYLNIFRLYQVRNLDVDVIVRRMQLVLLPAF